MRWYHSRLAAAGILLASALALGAAVPLRFSPGGRFKVALFADLHYGENAWTDWGPAQDDRSDGVMAAVLDAEKPDFVVYLGDLVTANNVPIPNATLYWDRALSPARRRRIPWATVFGNHDDMPFEWPPEWFSPSGVPPVHCPPSASGCSFGGTPRIELMKAETDRDGGLSRSSVGPEELWPGVSNYILQVLSREKERDPALLMYFLDSGGGSYPEVISGAQVRWFQSQSRFLNPNGRIPELIFWHIPSTAYAEVAPKAKSEIRKPCVGSLNMEDVAPQAAEWGIMDALAKRPSVKKMNRDVEDFDNQPSKKAKYSKSSVLDDPLPSPTISASTLVSLCSESTGSESDSQINCDKIPSPVSPTMSTLSPPSESMNEETISEDGDKETVSEDGDKETDKQTNKNKNIVNEEIYDYLPQDYTLTVLDECAHCVIEDSLKEEILVKIDNIWVKQRYLVCLLDKNKWLDDEVISAYICCLKEQNQNGANVYFENPFVTGMLKRDGEIGIDGHTAMTNIVKNYLNHDMIHLPINIKDSHWYLACINVKKYEIQVLDSLCWEHNRDDLTITIQGLQYHLDILKSQENLNIHNWIDLDITEWVITEQLQQPIQKDSSSCGLFMLKFMEYWTGHTLSHPITQEMITPFRYKLASILLCWKTNTAPMTTMVESNDNEGDPNDCVMSDMPFDKNQSKELNSLSVVKKYQSLMTILCTMSLDELVGGLCNYIKSINSAEALQKIWIQSSQPYPISLTLKKLQEMLKEELPMDRDCFNLVVRKVMFDDIQMVKKRRGLISKHYLDMQFWMITDFGRHPSYRKKLDVEQLAYSVRSWPGIKYSVSSCNSIHIPVQSNSEFILFILDKDIRTVYILDPNPIDPIYQRNPHAKYMRRLLWIAEYLPKAMSKACPGSTWNENIFLWKQKIVHDISGHNRELSGYLVTLFMSTWDDEKVHLPFLKDGYNLRKQILGQLLTFKENECEDNMPSGVLDFINCIRKIQTNMNVEI